MMHVLYCGDEMELELDGEVFYSGPTLPLIPTINVIREKFHVDVGTAFSAWREAKKETV